ncbi:MAG: DUF1858 domain-containing protein [Deinococcales bacterium]
MMARTDHLTLAPMAEALELRLRVLLEERVSVVLDAVPGALELLLEHGFTPLAQPSLRRMLAPTVTLRQALALRGLPAWREEVVLRALAELQARGSAGRCGLAEGGGPCP